MPNGINKEQLAALIKINNITGYLPLNLQEMLLVVGKELEGLFPPYRCYFVLNCKDLELKPLADGFDGKITCLCAHKREGCRAINGQLPVISYDLQNEHPVCCAHHNEPQAHICVPLISGSEAFGTLSLRSPQPVMLTRDQLELLLAIANQTAATIQRARLFSRLEQEKERLTRANHHNEELNETLKNTIRRLKATQDQLILSERLAAAGYLAANFAHEINNPTGIILSRLECLEWESEDLGLPETVLKDLAVIKKHANRIARITRGLLTFSRQSRQPVQPVLINEIILETVDWLAGQFAHKGIQFDLQLSDAPQIQGNREQLQQVLVNMLTNARDAMPEGGQIKIVTLVNQEQRLMKIDITDNGIGIAADKLSKVFDPFFTTKEVGKGTGLGLSISYSIVQEHSGSIEVTSKEGEGTTLSIKLPLSDVGEE